MTPITPTAAATRSASLMQALSNELHLPSQQLYSFTRLHEDLLLDTMDIDLLVAGLERKLGYYLTEEEASQIETVGDIQHFFLR